MTNKMCRGRQLATMCCRCPAALQVIGTTLPIGSLRTLPA
jgi:hypothetical protein